MGYIMDEIDKIGAMVEVAESNCALEHHDDIDWEAVDAIILPMGFKESEDVYRQEGDMVIPICKECAESLADPDDPFILFYCIGCNNSQWLYLPLAKKDSSCYNKINWVEKCPKCPPVKKIITN